MKKLAWIMILTLLQSTVIAVYMLPTNNTLPNTFADIYFVGNYKSDFTDSQAQFACAHNFIWEDNRSAANVARIRQYQPRFINLMYRNTIGAKQAWIDREIDSLARIDSDYVYCRDSTGVIALYRDTVDIKYNAAQNKYDTLPVLSCRPNLCWLLNPGYPPPSFTGSPGATKFTTKYRDLWVGTQERLRDQNVANGFWLDNGTSPYGGVIFPSPWDARFWARALASFLDSAKTAHPNTILIPNTAIPTNPYMFHEFKVTKIDGFGGEGYFDTSKAAYEWLIYVSRGLEADRLDKGWMPYYAQNPSSLKVRMFQFASFLITKGSRSYFAVGVSGVLSWKPEYGIKVGYPLDLQHRTVATFSSNTLGNVYRGGRTSTAQTGWFARKFSNALVVVNPEKAITYGVSLDTVDSRTLYECLPSATQSASVNFAVSSLGRTVGSMTYQRVTGPLTLMPMTGRIFVADTNYVVPDTVYPAGQWNYRNAGVSVEEGGALPLSNGVALLEISPNPAMSRAVIRLVGQSPDGALDIRLYDLRGAKIADVPCEGHTRTVAWNLPRLNSGVYILRASVGRYTVARRLTVLQ